MSLGEKNPQNTAIIFQWHPSTSNKIQNKTKYKDVFITNTLGRLDGSTQQNTRQWWLQGSHDNGTTICRAIVAFHCKNNVPE